MLFRNAGSARYVGIEINQYHVESLDVLSEEADRQDLDKIFCYELLAVKMIVWAIRKVIIKYVL